MTIQNVVIETQPQQPQQTQPQPQPRRHAQQQQKENNRSSSFMKAVLIKQGEYTLGNSIVLPDVSLCLLGEHGTILVPLANVLPILGVGNKDIKCTRCHYILAMKIQRPQIQDITIKCPNCATMNQL